MTAREHPLLPLRRASTLDAAGALLLRDTLGRPLRDLRISVMDRCNFRCPYCMPQHTFHDGYRFLASAERLSFEEIVRLARLGARLGVRKLRLTGGEPLLRPNLPDLIGDLSGLAGIEDVALTTNGILLAKYATELKAAGLHRVTVSLDSLDPAVFARMSGGFGGVEQVLEGIDAARRAGLGPVKVNAVIQRGINDHTALALVEHFRGTGVIVRFIEYMDVGNRNDWRSDMVVPSSELAAAIAARWPMAPVDRNYTGEVAERLGEPALLRRLFAGAALLGRDAVLLPVRDHRRRPARPLAGRCRRRCARRPVAQHLGAPGRPLQRTARAAARGPRSQGRDVPRRRLRWRRHPGDARAPQPRA
jgi:cyclic pyranopterin phosphate synthase